MSCDWKVKVSWINTRPFADEFADGWDDIDKIILGGSDIIAWKLILKAVNGDCVSYHVFVFIVDFLFPP